MAAPALDLHVASKSGGNSTLRLTGDEGAYTFGGGYNVDNADPAVIMIPDQMVSRVHCSLSWSEDIGWMLADLAGTNGTFVNGHLITAPVLLQSGGTFRIGGSVVRVSTTRVPNRKRMKQFCCRTGAPMAPTMTPQFCSKVIRQPSLEFSPVLWLSRWTM